MLREVKLTVAEDLVKMAAGKELDDGDAQDVKFFLICCKVKDNSGQATKIENHFEKVHALSFSEKPWNAYFSDIGIFLDSL